MEVLILSREKKKGFFLFGKKEKKAGEVAEQEVEEKKEEVVSALPAQKFQRKRRIVETQEEVSVEEVKEAVSKSIFKKDISDKDEKDLLDKKKLADTSAVFHMGLKEESEDTVMGLSQEIADAFGIQTSDRGESLYEYQEKQEMEKKSQKNEFSMFDTSWKPEEKTSEIETEESTEEERAAEEETLPLTEEQRNKRDVLARLKEVTALYKENPVFCENGFCELETAEDSLYVVKTERGLLFSNYRVFVDGVLQFWDKTFEVKISKGAQVEVETGVHLKIPQGVKAELCSVKELEEKHALHFLGGSIEGEVVAFFQAGEGAYLSKIGRIVQCQFVGG